MAEDLSIPEQNTIKEPNIITWENSLKFTEADWFDVLSKSKGLSEFNGNHSRAALVLTTLSQGILETFEEFNKRGIVIKLSNIGVDFKNQGPAIRYDTNNVIVINLDFLQSLSNASYSLEELYEFKRSDSSISYKGKLLEWVLSMGDEEAHHSIFVRAKKITNNHTDALDMSMSEYDAQIEEFRALRWVIQKAKMRKFSNVAVEYLEERYKNAKDLLER